MEDWLENELEKEEPVNLAFLAKYEKIEELPFGGGVSGIGWRVKRLGDKSGIVYCAKIYKIEHTLIKQNITTQI